MKVFVRILKFQLEDFAHFGKTSCQLFLSHSRIIEKFSFNSILSELFSFNSNKKKLLSNLYFSTSISDEEMQRHNISSLK